MAKVIDLTGHLRLPGLVNAHDHLEFNLFPALGLGGYRNAGEWARDIYRPLDSPVREQLKVPKGVRLWWGGLKNLLSGVTTVCHHNPYEPEVFDDRFPVRVVRRMAWAHSLEFDTAVTARFRAAPRGWPFVVHCAEGVDSGARREVAALDAEGALDGRTSIVHGVGLTPAGIELMRRRGAAVIWCPSSNLGMLGRTVSRAVLRSGLPIALATDSALSAPVDLLDELRVAHRFVGAERLYEMVTTLPAAMLRLSRTGDWIAVKSTARSPHRALLEGSIALVVVRGRIRLISPELAEQLPRVERRRLQLLHVEGRAPVLVDAPVAKLRRAAARHLGSELRLAGKRILS